MKRLLLPLLVSLILSIVHAQFNPQTYPDPRSDPAGCKIVFPGQICDPSEILSSEQRAQLNEKILRLQQITSNIRNTSPPCVGSQNSNLFIMVALIDKLGTVPFESVSVEKFTNLLRSRYQNYQDISACDTMVLIVNSRTDRQVFTVAGRDAKLSREVLQSAFHRNLVHFRSGNYAMGLEGMIEFIVSAYNSAHIVQVPNIHAPTDSIIQLPSAPVSSPIGQFAAVHGVRQKADMKPAEKLSFDDVPEEDRVWVELMSKAVSRCGNDPAALPTHLRAVVEEAMALSLKLISDNRYNRIEELSQDVNSGPQSIARGKAWQSAQSEWIDALYTKYERKLSRPSQQCPEVAIIALCYFCENHGPRVVLCCQPTRNPPEQKQPNSKNEELPHFYGDGMQNDVVDEDARCGACSSFGSGFGIVSNDHDAKTSYFSSQTPINEQVYHIVKETCLRTLSVEYSTPLKGEPTDDNAPSNGIIKELKSGENNKAVLFGDRETGFTLSCSFKLRDAKARGFQRQYALVVVTVDEMMLLNNYDFFLNGFSSIILRLQKRAADTFKVEQLQSGDVPLEAAAGRMMFMPQNFFTRTVTLDTERSLATIVSDDEVFYALHRQALLFK
ncbi:hypothetical protein M3Y99_00183900 [Aphelenchoides fujianensis]|nr:hypothetical protein M3Y99_00183900 [Aphelenchoides fujianensis]